MEFSSIHRGIKRKGVMMAEPLEPQTRTPLSWTNNKLLEDSDESSDEDEDNFNNLPDLPEEDDDSLRPNEAIRADFLQYVEHAHENFGKFTANERNAVKLLLLLRRTKASLDTYEAVMEWHFRAAMKLRHHEKLCNHPDYVSRKTLFKKLMGRYNLTKKVNLIKKITLPSSRARATIVKNDAGAMLQSLLSDPRIEVEDYLFFDDDPLSPPPERRPTYIGDINTGEAYRKTYTKLVRRPGEQVLLPVIFYMDGAATGQFADLTLTALKFTLGIFTRKARQKPHLWRTLGYLPKVSANTSRGRRKLLESGHVDGMVLHQDMLKGEGNSAASNVHKAQDMHTMMAELLREFVDIQNTGFIWDLQYKGVTYRGIEFLPFVPFFKCDTDEADRLTGSFTSRGKGVAQLCRYCCCPTEECDQIRADYPRKTVDMVSTLVEADDAEGLNKLSQQNIDNALYSLRFGAHSEEGVHGACPMEMLHHLLLGVFKYVRDVFFQQIGEESEVAREVNSLAVELGGLFGRQSDRDLPKTKFYNGIQKGKLMAKEYTGVLLIIAAILRSTEGRRLLSAHKHLRFARDKTLIDDWVLLVETLLLWEEWLKSEEMHKKDIHRAKEKHLYIMYLVKKTARRTKGMGLKIVKFHAIMHMALDIMRFGVPMNFDTGSDEAGHKPSKTAAKVTQKRKELFDQQVEERLTEMTLLELAAQEVGETQPKWWYFDDDYSDETSPEPEAIPTQCYQWLGGSSYTVLREEDGEERVAVLGVSSQKPSGVRVEAPFADFIKTLTHEVGPLIPNVTVRTKCRQGDVIYRGTADFSGGVWRDWVVVDWGSDGKLPNKIWGFVDLSDLPATNELNCGGLSPIPPGVYAIVESATYVTNRREKTRSRLFVPLVKDVGKMVDGRVTDLKFYLADVEAFDEPVAVIPDIGGASNAYLLVRKRAEWREDFIKWLRQPYEDCQDTSEEEDEDSEAEEDEESAEEDEESEA